MRDLNTSLWAAKARFGVSRLSELAAVGAATERQQSALLDARDFLRRLRLSMHLSAGRAQDQLLFETQELLGPRLFPEQLVPGETPEEAPEVGVAPAVERLMHAYYRHARTVVIETEGILQRCSRRRNAAVPQRREIDECFHAVGGLLCCAAPRQLWEQPAQMVRAFVLAAEHDLALDRSLKDTISEAAASGPGLQLAADDDAISYWRALLRDPERKDRRLSLESMHECGVLSAVIPEFEPCTGRVQHDLYHVYTVDRHSLYVVGMLKALRRREFSEGYQMAATVMAELQKVETLYLAALLHDVAKPLGKQHSVKGARLAAGVAARLGLPADEQEEVVFLVRHHLTMPHLSQRRDLADPSVIDSFAQLVGDVGRLRRLYLLSVADTVMTAPNNMTGWKASLLNELFAATYRRLTSGSASSPATVLERRRADLRERLRESWGDAGDAMVARLPDDLVGGHETDALLHHVGVALELEYSTNDNRLRIGTRRHDASTTVVTVCCEDGPAVLAAITGAMVLHRIQVLAANIYTLTGGKRGLALDIFWVTTDDPVDFRSWLDFSATLDEALGDEKRLARMVEQRIRPSGLPQRVLPRVQTEIVIDNSESERCTIVELHAADMRGLLHSVTHRLSALNLQIDVARVATQAGQVSDIFYVRDRTTGQKLLEAARIEHLEQKLRKAWSAWRHARSCEDQAVQLRR
jgi:[protein-PII] uridylyltransferase